MNTAHVVLFGNLLESSLPPGMTPSTVSLQSWRRSHHLWHGGYWHASRLCLNIATPPSISCIPSKTPGLLDAGLQRGKVILLYYPKLLNHSAFILGPWRESHLHVQGKHPIKQNAVAHLGVFLLQSFALSLNILLNSFMFSVLVA